jgi:hypothetical protein
MEWDSVFETEHGSRISAVLTSRTMAKSEFPELASENLQIWNTNASRASMRDSLSMDSKSLLCHSRKSVNPATAGAT